MRPTLLLCMLVVSGYVTNAQLTILPQLGFERSRTSVQFNEHPSFSPLGASFIPQAAVRIDYKNKQGYGPYLSIATSRNIVELSFTDPQSGMNSYAASKSNIQFRLEGGFQVSTRPIYFKKTASAGKSTMVRNQNAGKTSCGNYMARNHCGSKVKKTAGTAPASKGSWIRIQPAVGLAYTPFMPSAEIQTKTVGTQTTYGYNAGNRAASLISGVGLEFGNNQQSKFVLSVNYVKGLGSDVKSITTTSGNKPTTTTLKSGVSGWNLRMGIPISFGKKKAVVVKQELIKSPYRFEHKSSENRCGQYRSGCRKLI